MKTFASKHRDFAKTIFGVHEGEPADPHANHRGAPAAQFGIVLGFWIILFVSFCVVKKKQTEEAAYVKLAYLKLLMLLTPLSVSSTVAWTVDYVCP